MLNEGDCQMFASETMFEVQLGGSFSGTFKIYAVRIRIPELDFNQRIRAVSVPSITAGFDGIACFRFLNRFTYGNFGDHGQFGLET